MSITEEWRATPASFPSAMTFTCGIWVLLSPWFLGLANGAGNGPGQTHQAYWPKVWNLFACGWLIVILSGIRNWHSGKWSFLSWINVAVAVWIIISPWVFGDSGSKPIIWNDVVSGAVFLVLSAWAAVGYMYVKDSLKEIHPYGRGASRSSQRESERESR